MPVNKVVLGEQTLIDLSNDTVTEEDLFDGVTAHDKHGKLITGRLTPAADTVDGYHVRVVYNSSEPPADVLTNEVCFFCNGG